jgi:DNA-binding MarR family transcriptional regulator
MNSGSPEQKETEALIARFQAVMESSFKRAGKNRMYPVTNKIFTSLTINQIRALHMLLRSPGMAQKELAEHLEVTPAAVSTAVKQLERLGLVERRSNAEDARQKRIYLSEYGEQVISENQNARNHAIASLLNTLTLDEQHMIVEILERAMMRQQEAGSTDPPDTQC